MSHQSPHLRLARCVDANSAHGATVEPRPTGSAMATLASEITVYTTERVKRVYGSGVQEVVLRAFGDALERADAAYGLGSVATRPVPVPDGIDSTGELLDAFRAFLPTTRTSTRCNLLVVDEDAYDGPVRTTRIDRRADLGGLAVSRGAAAISRDLGVGADRYGDRPGDFWLNRCLFAAASVYGVSAGQGRVRKDADRDGRVATPAATDASDRADAYDHSFADDAAATLRRAV